MGRRVYSAARTDPLITTGLIDKFTNPPPTPAPRRPPRVELQHVHVHGRGVAYQAGCPECQTINRAYYHAHKKAGTRPYKRKKI